MDRLVIVRGSNLDHLPFEVLPTSQLSSGFKPSDPWKYMVEDFEIVYRYAARLPRVAKKVTENSYPFLLALGSSLTRRSGERGRTVNLHELDRLHRTVFEAVPAVDKELEWLQSEMGQSVLVLRDTSATISNLKAFAKNSTIIHIASHSGPRNDPSLSSSIFLSSDGSGNTSEPLRVIDILKMNIRAQLVVLSSCRTARPSEIYSGIDFVKSFLIAGAGSVVASEWDVDDEKTAELMKLFYGNLKSGVRKSKALQEAKKQMIRRGVESPYYWGSFILIGDDDPIYFSRTSSTWQSAAWVIAASLVILGAMVIAIAVSFFRGKRKMKYGL